MAFRQTLLRWIARHKKSPNRKKRRQVNQSQSQHSVEEVETDASPGIVEATVDDQDTRDTTEMKVEEDGWPGDWETDIANSLSGTLEFVI